MTLPSRRSFLRVCGTAVGTATVGCIGFGQPHFERNCSNGSLETGPGTAGGDASWPQYAGDPGNPGFTTASGPDEPTLAWRHATCDPMGMTSPVVADGSVYVSRHGSPGTISFDVSTGEREWTDDFNGHAHSPAVGDRRLYAVGRGVAAFDVEDGSTQWTFEPPDAETASDRRITRMYATPTLTDETVYVPGESDRPWLYALDASTGDVRWRRRPGGNGLRGTPAVGSRAVYVVTDPGTLVAIDRDDGDVRWTAEEPWAPADPPVVFEDRVYVVDRNSVRVRTTDGEPLWRKRQRAVDAPVAVDGSRVYATRQSNVIALAVSDGSEVWSRDTAWEAGLGAPVAADGTVYVGGRGDSVGEDYEPEGRIFAIDAESGDLEWEFTTRGIPAGEGGPYAGTFRSLAVGDGTVFACTDAGDLYAIADP